MLATDQETVKTLIKETITLLCKNGLEFRNEFCIDAVIGVTLDKDTLFYISLNETVKSDNVLAATAPVVDTEASHGSHVSPRDSHCRKQKPRKRLTRVTNFTHNEDGLIGDEDEISTSPSNHDPSSESIPPLKRRMIDEPRLSPGHNKMLKTENEDTSDTDSEEEAVIIKEEPGDQLDWNQSVNPLDANNPDIAFQNYNHPIAGPSLIPTDTGFQRAVGAWGITADTPVFPGGSQSGIASQGIASQHGQGIARQGTPQKDTEQEASQFLKDTDPPKYAGSPFRLNRRGSGAGKFRCDLCDYSSKRMYNLRRHVRTHMYQDQHQGQDWTVGVSNTDKDWTVGVNNTDKDWTVGVNDSDKEDCLCNQCGIPIETDTADKFSVTFVNEEPVYTCLACYYKNAP